MPKRKRSAEEAVAEQLEKARRDVHRALKAAKGFERQRQAKRMRDSKSTADKLKRLEREVLVLKSLDLEQVANAHLCSSLLRIKAIADAPELPVDVKRGVAKPNLSEEEAAALHNVTSSLYNRNEVRAVVEKAIAAICDALGIPVPRKKGKTGTNPQHQAEEGNRQRPSPELQALSEPTKKGAKQSVEGNGLAETVDPRRAVDRGSDSGGQVLDEDEWQGFSDNDSSGEEEPEDGEGEDEEEKAISRYEAMLGGGSSDEDEDDGDEEDQEVFISRYKALLGSKGDDISDGDPDEDDLDEDDDDDLRRSFSGSSSPSPEPRSQTTADGSEPKKKKPKEKSKSALQARPGDSTFLPSLMGGYISGSESASDVDVAPALRKNRRGQKARQAISEMKYGAKAKHLANEKTSARDAGWDARRGAVESGDRAGRPWKRGIHNPLKRRGGGGEQVRPQGEGRAGARPPVRRRDDSQDAGPLHPSWEAKRKAKEQQQTAAFAGKKISFD